MIQKLLKKITGKSTDYIVMLKVAMLTGKIKPSLIDDMILAADEHERINLLKCSIGWYFEEISEEDDIFEMVKKVCDKFDINFYTLNQKSFFSVCKSIKVQNEVIAKMINDIKYPELNDIQKEAGYGDKNFGMSGVICNLAEAFGIDYLTAEQQPVIAITRLRMNAHLAVCRDREEKIKQILKTEK